MKIVSCETTEKTKFIDAFVPELLFFSVVTIITTYVGGSQFGSMEMIQVVIESMGFAFGVRDMLNRPIVVSENKF